MEEHRVEASPRRLARLGGVLYLILIVLGIFGEVFVRGRIVVPGDAAATAANLRSMESLWRFGLAAELVSVICVVPLAVIFFVLLRPVGRDLALLMLSFDLVAIALGAAVQLPLLAALFSVGNAGYLRAFAPEQLSAITSLSVRLHGYGFGLSLALWCNLPA